MQKPKKDLKVKVAMRVRPLNSKEIEAGSVWLDVTLKELYAISTITTQA